MNDIVCCNNKDLVMMLPDNFIDLVIADPPYGLGMNFFGDNEDRKIIAEKVRVLLVELFPKIKFGATICVFCNNQLSHNIYHSLEGTKYNWQNDIIWYREREHGTNKKLSITHEVILVYTKGKTHKTFNLDEIRIQSKYARTDKRLNPKGKNPGSVWYAPGLLGKKSERILTDNGKSVHDSQKPIAIIQPLITAYSNPNDIIFDPYLGTGTTSLLCQQLNRNFIGCDIEEEYCRITNKRKQAVY